MVSSKEESLAQKLAEFCCSMDFTQLPEPVVEKVKQCTLDILGVFAAGSRMPWSRQVAEFVRQVTGQPQCLVIGNGFRADVCNAAFANGTSGHSIEMDEQHNPSITHPSPVLIATGLAVGEKEAVNGQEFIVATTLGYEVMTRVGTAVAPSILVDRGFHPTAATGTLGAAAVAGRLIGLSETQMAHALSIAAMHSSGLFEYLLSGGNYKRAHPGMAAYGGIRSAMLAKLGMTGPMSVLEGQRGFLNAFSNSPDPSPILDGLGSDFEVLKVAFKPYACCRLVHSSIDAITALKNKHGLKPESVDSVTIHTCSQMSKFNNPRPHDIMSSQFSIPFGVALAILDGSNLPKDYTPENLERKDLLDFCGKVRVVADTSMDQLYPEIIGARAAIEVKGKEEVTEYVKFPTGEPENPMSREALLEKFRSLLSTILPEERTRRIETAVEGLEEMEDIRKLTDLMATDARAETA